METVPMKWRFIIRSWIQSQRASNRATAANLQSELKCLAAQWPRLKMSALEEYRVRIVGDGSDGGEEET